MLRRKLLVILFSVTALLMVLAMAALIGLQAVFSDMNHINTDATALLDRSSELKSLAGVVEADLYLLPAHQGRRMTSRAPLRKLREVYRPSPVILPSTVIRYVTRWP